MGLITEYLEINVGNQRPYYESKGYIIPTMKSADGKRTIIDKSKPLKIKTIDLPQGSNREVEVQCDKCKEIKKLKYSVYIRYNHNGAYYCNKCAPSIFITGENNPRWNPNIDHDKTERMNSPEYREFNKIVRAKCNHQCFCCKEKLSGNGDVHHLNSHDWDVENRLNPNNAVLLCDNCHKKFHSIYGYGNNTKEQFLEWAKITEIKYDNDEVIITKDKKIINLETKEIYNSVFDCKQILGIKDKDNSINDCCNHKDNTFTIRGYHLLWLDEYNQMSKGEIFAIKTKAKNQKVIICLDTGKIFFSLRAAADEYGININSLVRAYKGESKKVGKKEWKPLDEFLRDYSEEKIKEVLQRDGDNDIETLLEYKKLI